MAIWKMTAIDKVYVSLFSCGVLSFCILVFVGPFGPIKPGQTVTDPGQYVDGSSFVFKGMHAMPLNWEEIPESEHVAMYSLYTGSLNENPVCVHQLGATMTALEVFEDEVLVRYSNPKTRERFDQTCPSDVLFWVSAKDFLNADSEFKRLMDQKAETEKREAKENERERKKHELVRRHLKMPSDSGSFSPEKPEVDSPRRLRVIQLSGSPKV